MLLIETLILSDDLNRVVQQFVSDTQEEGYMLCWARYSAGSFMVAVNDLLPDFFLSFPVGGLRGL